MWLSAPREIGFGVSRTARRWRNSRRLGGDTGPLIVTRCKSSPASLTSLLAAPRKGAARGGGFTFAGRAHIELSAGRPNTGRPLRARTHLLLPRMAVAVRPPLRGSSRAGGDVDGAPSIFGALRPQRLSRVDPRDLLPAAQARIVAGPTRFRRLQGRLASYPDSSSAGGAELPALWAAVDDRRPHRAQVPGRDGRSEQLASALQ